MTQPSKEEQLLHSTALQNVKSILQARQRGEEELVQAKEALEVRAQELARSVATLRATLESTSDAILVTGPGGELVDYNDKLAQIWGLSRERLAGMDRDGLWRAIAQQTRDAPSFLARLAQIEGSAAESFDQLELVDGRVLERFSTVQRVDDAIAGRVWSLRDVTERKMHEAALRSSHAQFSATVQHSPVGILLVDSSLRLSQVNSTARPMLGDIEPLIGREVGDVLHLLWPEAVANEMLERFRSTLATGEPYVGRGFSTFRTDRGVREHYDWQLHRLTLQDGRHGIVCYLIDISDHVHAREALRNSEQRVRATFEQAAVGMAVAALDGRFLQVNRRFSEMLGYSVDELCERTFLDVTYPEDHARTLDRCQRLLAGKIADFSIEKRYLRKDGSSVWCLTTVALLKTAAGEPERFVSAVEEITERKRAEERERENAERLQLALSAGRLGDWSWDAASDVVILSARAAAIFELPPGSLITWSAMRQLLHAEDRERARVAVEDALRNRSDYDIEYRVNRPGRDEIWIAAKGRGIYAADGKVIGMTGVVQDVTERKRLEVVRTRLAAVVESSDDAIVSKDLDGVVRTWNTGAERIFGYTAAEMVGQPITRLIPPELHDEETSILHRLRHGQRIEHFETVRVTKSGARIDVSLTVSPVRDASGKVVGASKVARDITARKYAEAELRRSEERAAADRQALLEAERSARAEAERVSFMKDEFLATLSHELRTPLNAIVGWSQVLRARGHADAEVLEGLTVIDRNAKVQAQLIEDLLDMSRIISGKVRLDVQRVDVQDVVRAAIASVRHSVDSKGIRLQVVLDPLAGPVWGDPSRLQQCFWNLLSNAIKFTPKGGKVQVTLARVDSHLEFAVDDDGQGIALDFLPHVFERFRQADASTTRFHGGLGLGLSIVKSLVELHGGAVHAASPGIGKGATFRIELPVMIVGDVALDRRREHPLAGATQSVVTEHQSLAGITVLAVDDEPDARGLIKRVLEDCGARVLVAESARAGLELLQREKPDILISDIGMPNEDGYTLIRQVRTLPADQGGRTPAAALSAFARPEDRTRALRAGYQMHLSKPVEPTELTAVVASLAMRQ